MTTSHDTWKLGLNDSHFEDDSYGRDPYRYDHKVRMWRDAETGRFVGKRKPKD